MNYNKFNLRQLLQLALRVPEIGAVNFNILYYILKTIIEKEGLEEVKPVFSLDLVATVDDSKESSIHRSCSAESLYSAKDGLKGKYDMYDEKYHKESFRWDKIKVFKRLDGVEEEIDSIHDVLAQLDGKVSNLEKGFVLQETRLDKELAGFCESVESKLEFKEYNILFENMEEVISKVAVLMNMKEEMSKLRQKCEEIAAEIEDVAEQVSQIQYEKSLEALSLEPEPSAALLSKTDSREKNKLMKKESEPQTEDPKPEISNLITGEISEKGIQKEAKKSSRQKEKEQEILSKIETLNEEIFSIKEHLKSRNGEKDGNETERRITDLEDSQLKQEKNIEKIDLQLLNLYKEINKLMEKCNELDRSFYHDINQIKDKSFKLERSSNSYVEELEGIKMVMDGMVHNFDSMKENLKYMEMQIAVITEFPGLKNRIEQLEEYVYSGSDQRIAKDDAKDSRKKRLKLFKPTSEKTAKSPEHEVKEYIDESGLYDESEEDFKSKRFHIVSKSVRLAQDMQKKKKILKFSEGLHKTPDTKDVLYEEWKYSSPQKLEDFKADDFEEIRKVPLHPETAKTDTHEKVKSTSFTSPELLEEHSLQLKTQVIIYVKEKLHDFEIELQIIERNMAAMKEKTDSLEKYCKELGEKIIFMNANFSQRAGDIAALKNTAETHQASIVSIMHHLERKAEAYIVNQKVSRKELTVIEDRVLKLCKTASSEINKLEEKINDSVEKFSSELDKKLFIEEFEIHLDSLKHKLKVFDIKLKDLSVKPTVIDLDDIRPPVEIKKYVLCKDEIKIKQGRRIIATGKTRSSPDHFLPLLCQHFGDREVSPKMTTQIQKELQSASTRESKRYIEGAYTKIKVGRK